MILSFLRLRVALKSLLTLIKVSCIYFGQTRHQTTHRRRHLVLYHQLRLIYLLIVSQSGRLRSAWQHFVVLLSPCFHSFTFQPQHLLLIYAGRSLSSGLSSWRWPQRSCRSSSILQTTFGKLYPDGSYVNSMQAWISFLA
jgi:hypothetical protein